MSVAVVDAAAVVDLLTGAPPAAGARAALLRATGRYTPAHLDAEVLSALARMLRAGVLADIQPHLTELATLPVTRLPVAPLVSPAAALLERVAAKDALYVALTRSLDGWLLTTDERLRRAVAGIVPTDPPDA